jgi:hypothetical protein
MSRHSIALALAVVLAIAVAVPVFAQSRQAGPHSVRISKRALKMARTALRTSRAAKRQARRAETSASAALAAAPPRAGSALAPGAVTASGQSYAALPGGPSVAVEVPFSGLVEVWGQAEIAGAGAVGLFADGAFVPGQAETCGPAPGQGALFSTPGAGSPEESLLVATPAAFGFCSVEGAPGPVLFRVSPGPHSFELRYAACGCAEEEGGTTTFSQRWLVVAPHR